MSLFLASEETTNAIAGRLAAVLPDDIATWTVLLQGELGAGKSTFARAFLRSLGHDGPVPSPTYTLVEPYSLARGDVVHADLYRITSPEELVFLGWTDFAAGCRLVEWPDRVPGLEQGADIRVELEYDGEGRLARFVGLSARGKDVVAKLLASPNT